MADYLQKSEQYLDQQQQLEPQDLDEDLSGDA